MPLHFLKSFIISTLKAIVYVFAWCCELTGRMLVTISESLFKLTKR